MSVLLVWSSLWPGHCLSEAGRQRVPGRHPWIFRPHLQCHRFWTILWLLGSDPDRKSVGGWSPEKGFSHWSCRFGTPGHLFCFFFDNQLFKIFSGHPCRHINPYHGQRGRLDRKEKAFHLPPLRLHCLQRQLLVQLVPHGLLLVSLNQASGRFWLLYLCLGWFSSQILFLWWMIFEAIHEFLGGRHVITVVAVLYITDITSVESRWPEFLRMVIV